MYPGVHFLARKGAVALIFLVTGLAAWVLFAGEAKRPLESTASQATLGSPARYPQLVSVELLSAIDGKMCQWVPASTSTTLMASVVKGYLSGPAISASSADGEILGGDIPPVRTISDPYPTFNGIAVDAENNIVAMSDTNRKSLLIYDRAAGNNSAEETRSIGQVLGPDTQVGFVAGVAVDPVSREVYTVNNDIENRLVVFPYDAVGNAKPKRILALPHGTWGISLSRPRNEMAITVQAPKAVIVFRREAEGFEAPLRVIRGPNTGMADPHGVYLDDANNEIVVANYGSWSNEGYGRPIEGRNHPPSITIYPATADGDVKPLRTIAGPQTQLNWPSGISVDTTNDVIAVANNGDNSILIFGRTDDGDAVPVRIIRGSRTGINRPMGVAIDTKNNELWAANFGDHTALVFNLTANGNVPPKRIIRNAPAGTPTGGFGNPMTIAYDTKREEILAPN